MSDDEVKRYRVYCIEENLMVTTYGTEVPTLCPNDHPDRTIDHLRTVQVDFFKKNQVEIFDPTEGVYQYTEVHLSIPAGSPGDVTTVDFSWPMNLKIWNTEFVPGAEHTGDTINVFIDPDRVVGGLTAAANIGDTEFTVTSTVFTYPYLVRGIEVKLVNGMIVENLGRITGIDMINFKFTTEFAATQSFPPGSLILLNLHIIKNITFSRVGVAYLAGRKGFQNKDIPPNIILRFLYTNSNGAAKDVRIVIDYNYF